MDHEIIGIIGGTGLYEIEGFSDITEIEVETPFGKPSDHYIKGTLEGKTCVFLARHGRKHVTLPNEINYRANIYGMKKLGVERILSVSAVGSMREEIHPGDMVFPHQFFDRTRERPSTFFGNGIVAHISFGDPICKNLSNLLYEKALELDFSAYQGGTYLCMEGPQFSTRAESEVYRQWGMKVIGMTNLQEAKLAREAEICYATIALVTDYDCWHTEVEDVSVEGVVEVLKNNASKAKDLIRKTIPSLSLEKRTCKCCSALENVLLTNKEDISEEVKNRLDIILKKYIS